MSNLIGPILFMIFPIFYEKKCQQEYLSILIVELYKI